MKVLANGTSVIISPTEPVIDTEGIVTSDYWRWLNSNNGRLYRYENDEWVVIGEAGLNLDVTVDIKKITHIKIVDGIVTELEYEQ